MNGAAKQPKAPPGEQEELSTARLTERVRTLRFLLPGGNPPPGCFAVTPLYTSGIFVQERPSLTGEPFFLSYFILPAALYPADDAPDYEHDDKYKHKNDRDGDICELVRATEHFYRA